MSALLGLGLFVAAGVLLASRSRLFWLNDVTRPDLPPPQPGHTVPDDGIVMVEAGPGAPIVSVDIVQGWNLITFQSPPLDGNPEAVFPGNESVYAWDPVLKTMDIPTEIVAGRAYWVSYVSSTTLQVYCTQSGVPLYWVAEWAPGQYWNRLTQQWEPMPGGEGERHSA